MILSIPGVYLSNNYLFWDNDSASEIKDAALIDAAAEPSVVLELLRRNGLRLKYIILTHGHYDHVANLPALIGFFPEAKALCASAEIETLRDPDANVSELFLDHGVSYPPLSEVFYDGDVVKVGEGDGGRLTVISTPGHTPGSCCLYNEHDKVMFTGDCLFADGGIGRVDFPGGSMRLMAASLNKLSRYPGDVTIYPGHGGTSTIGAELGGVL